MTRALRAEDAVDVVVRDGVAWMTLARPATGNRLDAELLGALADACVAVEDDDRVRVVVLGARGRVFSGGLPDGCAWPDPAWPDGIGAMAAVTKPVLGSIGGDAVGWGFALALACDVRIAARTATFAFPDVDRGHPPGGGVTQRLTRMVGPARALDLVLLGTPLPARRAAAWGVVAATVEPRRLDAAVEATARALASRAPLALRLGKEAVVRALDLPLAEGIRLEQDLYVLLQTTADRREGITAFRTRRGARFRGR